MNISRRSFLKGTAAMAGVAALSALNLSAFAEGEAEESFNITAEESTDVVVIGMGCSGLLAMCGAADKGAKVIGLDPASSVAATNACQTAGAWAVGSKVELACEKHIDKAWAFKFLNESTHFQSNAKTLSAMINEGGRAIDVLVDAGMSMFFPFQDQEHFDEMGVLNQGGHVWLVSGLERGKEFEEKLLAPRTNIDARWKTKAVKLIQDENGAVVAVLAQKNDSDEVTKINCKAAVVCTGGFIQNEEMVAKYYAGAYMIGPGNQYNNGAGITLAQAAGAQIGKNFSTSTNEGGSGNMKARGMKFSMGTENALFNLPLFGTLFLDSEGNRFIDESKMCEKTMYCGEPLLRDKYYYVIIDQAYVNKLASTPVTDFMGAQAIANMAPQVQMAFADKVLDHIEADLAEGMEDGYVWKADSLEELQEATGLANLAASTAAYNEFVASGMDTEMYKDAEYMKDAVTEGPFYAVQLQLSAWLTLGGIKTNGKFQAVDADNKPIKGLYMAGADADLWGVPYFQGGSAQGFCFASGLLAGENAAMAE